MIAHHAELERRLLDDDGVGAAVILDAVAAQPFVVGHRQAVALEGPAAPRRRLVEVGVAGGDEALAVGGEAQRGAIGAVPLADELALEVGARRRRRQQRRANHERMNI